MAALLGGAELAVLWVAACGLPLDGLAVAEDASLAEGGGDTAAADAGADSNDDTGPSAPCTLDAACLGTLPAGWQPVVVTDAGCGADFDAATLLVNPRVGEGGCACGACQLVGSFSCGGAVAISGGDGCNDPTLVTVAAGACMSAGAGAQHVEAHPPGATGTVGCFVPNDAGAGVTTDLLTLCIPGCGADYCGSSPRCILSAGGIACPAGFTLVAQAGTGADPGCPSCPCEAGPPGPCGGTVTVFGSAGCGDSGGVATYPVGTCNSFSTSNNYNSLIVDLVPPEASCSVPSTTPSPADASLVGVQTICCQ